MNKINYLIAIMVAIVTFSANAQFTVKYSNASGTKTYCNVKFLDNNIGYVVAQEGDILKTTDGGTTWTAKTALTGFTVKSIDFINENVGVAVGQSGKIYRTTDGAQTWTGPISIAIGSTTPTGAITRYLNCVRFYDSTTGYILGNAGTVLKTTDAGATWTRIINEASNGYNFASIIDATTLRIAPLFWSMYLLSGTTLTNATNLTTTSQNFGSYFFDANNGFVVGQRGSSTYADILKTTDGGTTWTTTINPATPSGTAGTTLRAVTFINSNLGLAVGDGATAYETTNGGTSWTKNSSATLSGALLGTCKLPNDYIFVVGVNKIYQYINQTTKVNSKSDENRVVVSVNSKKLLLSSTKEIRQVEIMSLAGSKLNSFKVNCTIASQDLSSLTKGVYMLKVITENGQIIKKIMVD